jgi:protoporphyrin/coproporphyrin ferrochelatase
MKRHGSETFFLLSNLGTPDAPTPEAVGVYLKEFLTDPFVIPLPAPVRHLLVRGIIVPRRKAGSAEKYAEIWTPEGSPLLRHSRDLLEGVRGHLGPRVLLGMRYGNPSLEEAIKQARDLGAGRLLAVPLYPQYANATSGSTAERFRSLCRSLGFSGAADIFPAFPTAEFFIRPLAARIAPRLGPEDHLLLTFHGLPESQLKEPTCASRPACCEQVGADSRCYRAHCVATAKALALTLGLGPDRWTLGFQSRFGRGRWISPYTENLLRELPARGVKRLVVAAPSFVADCLETLEEIGLRGRETFLAAGGEHYELVPALNSDPEFARGLAAALDAHP